MSNDPKSGDRGEQMFDAFVRTNEPPKPAAPPPPPDGGEKAPDPEPAPAPGPYMSCSECRAPMRDRYFALNERPICAKCRPEFARRIERGTSPEALQRAVLQGLMMALAGAAVLGTGLLFVPALRVFIVIPIGYYIGKRIMAVTGGYGGRRYQILAVGMTYFSIGLGSLIPAIHEANERAERMRAIQADTTRRLATQGKAIAEELDAFMAEQAAMQASEETAEETGDSTGVEEAADTSVVAAEKPAAKPPAGAEKPGVLDYLIAIVTLPLIAMLAFGYMAAGVGLFTFIYSLRQAWKQTDGQGLELVLKGPFKVGTGPIPATS